MKRRTFIQAEALAGAGVLLSVNHVLAMNAVSGSDPAVVGRLSEYSSRVAVGAADGEVHILAAIDNIEAYIDPDIQTRALPYQHMRAEGNTLSFTHRGVRYKLENVMPGHFDSRAGDLELISTGV